MKKLKERMTENSMDYVLVGDYHIDFTSACRFNFSG